MQATSAIRDSTNGPSLRATQVRAAARDIRDGFRRRWMWQVLAMQDIKLRYRGSVLGPFWVTISTFALVIAIGMIYPRLLNVSARDYIPYLAVGLVVWSFIATTINEGCSSLISANPVIRQIKLPFSIHAFRSVFRNLLTFAHSLAVIPFLLLAFATPLSWRMLLAIPAIVVLAINGCWITLLLGMLSARFRDIPPIVANFVSVAFFITPVFWHAEALVDEQWIAEINPLFAAVDVVRAPLIGQPLSAYSWPVLVMTTIVGCGVTFWVFVRMRSRIPYWV
jgi:ABC-2 type transport system permease protein/lipopolysaccharide transport system permease protein